MLIFWGLDDFAESAKYWLNWLKIAVLCLVAGESLNLTKKRRARGIILTAGGLCQVKRAMRCVPLARDFCRRQGVAGGL